MKFIYFLFSISIASFHDGLKLYAFINSRGFIWYTTRNFIIIQQAVRSSHCATNENQILFYCSSSRICLSLLNQLNEQWQNQCRFLHLIFNMYAPMANHLSKFHSHDTFDLHTKFQFILLLYIVDRRTKLRFSIWCKKKCVQ